MITGIDVNQRIEFTSQQDKDPKTVFILRPLTGIEMLEFGDLQGHENLIRLLDKSVVEVKGCPQDKSEFLKILPLNILADLMNKITELNHLTPEDKKKF